MWLLKRFVILCLLLTVLAGCQSVKGKIASVIGLQQIKEQQIAALEADFNQKLIVKEREKNDAIVSLGKARDTADQLAANAFYAQSLVYKSIPLVLRTDILIRNLGEEGWAALNHRLPTYETMQVINERITKDLDVAKTSLADLQKEHQAALIDNVKASDAAQAATDRLEDAQKSINTLKTTFSTDLAAKEREAKMLANQKAVLETARADDAAAVQALKTKISVGCAVFALLCAAGAIYLPVGRGGLAALSAVTAIAGAAIWVITGEMVLYAVLVCALALIGRAIYQHNTSNKTVAALTGYLHEKGQLADTDLQAWMTKYVTKNGVTTTTPDPAVQAVVQQQLISTNKL